MDSRVPRALGTMIFKYLNFSLVHPVLVLLLHLTEPHIVEFIGKEFQLCLNCFDLICFSISLKNPHNRILFDYRYGFVIAVTTIDNIGVGEIQPGRGFVVYPVKYKVTG